MIFIKYYLKENLKKRQLLREKLQNKYIKLIKYTFIELFIVIMHPNLLSKNSFLSVPEPIYGNYIPLSINNVF